MSSTAIRAEGLSKSYGAGTRAYGTLRDALFGRDQVSNDLVQSLDQVTFDLIRGECVAVLGQNGAGKTTLLKILARITHPSAGTVDIWGQVTALFEVGSGFHGELTGLENIFFNAALHGLSRRDTQRHLQSILEFSELEQAIHRPVKQYSRGMQLRLAFSVAIHLDPEILLLDEVFAVGDLRFQKKSFERLRAIKAAGTTILFVSHDLTVVEALADRVLVLDKGALVYDGSYAMAYGRYLELLGMGAATSVRP